MDVGYCPECNKPRLQEQRVIGIHRYNNLDSSLRYCPRCKKWVKPTYKNAMEK